MRLSAVATIFFAASAFASPPACLLACVNQQESPGSVKTICSSSLQDIANCLGSVCSDGVRKPASDAFLATCKDYGLSVVLPSVSGTPSATGSLSATKSTATVTGAAGSSTASSKPNSGGIPSASGFLGVLGLLTWLSSTL